MDFLRGYANTGIAICVLLMCASARAQQSTSDERDFYYYSGDVRVDIVIARDELATVGVAGRIPRLSALAALAPGGEVTETATGGAFIRYAAPAASLAEVSARARAAAATGERVAAVAYPASVPRSPELRGAITPSIAVKLNGRVPIETLEPMYGVRVVEKVAYSRNTYVVEVSSAGLFDSIETANAIFEDGLAEFATPLVLRKPSTRLIPNDPNFSSQWHLRNTGQVPGVVGEDVNVVGAWDSYTGAGVNIAVTDSGVQVAHPDLNQNARQDIDIDLNGGDGNPTPMSDGHGTSVAGIAAARGNNGIGVVGAAFEAGIVGIRMLEGPITDQTEADAMNHQVNTAIPNNYVHINNNSWGPNDCGCILGDAGPLVLAALANGTANGRGGLGTVYVWAAGNGRANADNVNLDAYASSRFTIAVGATGADGTFSWYSERGASLLVNTSSSDLSSGTTTTSWPSSYTNSFSGTSSASPLAAGVIALMLEANPDLSWRDVQHVLVESSEKNHPGDSDWQANGTGRTFNHNYGFGRVDAVAAVTLAEDWVPVPPNATPVQSSVSVNAAIPDNDNTGVSSNAILSSAPADFFIEHIEVVANISHTDRGQLFIQLTAPSGFTSRLATVHNDSGDDYANWQFTTVGHWGENPNGIWQLNVRDLESGFTGTLNNWTITFHGFHGDDWVVTEPPDTDQDLLTDEDEIDIYGTNPNDPDSDDDGVIDGTEVDLGTDPLDPDDTPLLPAGAAFSRWTLLCALLALSCAIIGAQPRLYRLRGR